MWGKLIVFVASALCVYAHHERVIPMKAIARFYSEKIKGDVTFTQLEDGKVHVTGTLTGLPAGQYGFHVHEKGDILEGCKATGGHFNPEHKDHGHPNDVNRHAGDLGNVVFDDQQTSKIDFVDSVISLVGPHGILGRAVVLHSGTDDYGRTSHPDSRKTGNAGGRVACAVIGLLAEEFTGYVK